MADVDSVSRRELGVAALVAALLAFVPLAGGLLGRGVVFGVDSATAQLPWSAVVEDAPEELPRNPTLSDQALGFYPFYRWVSESWRGGDPPLWNPLIYAGVPGIGNPQTGALDPQVAVLVGLEALFGRAAFDWGLGFTSWLRLVAALLGAWLLARLLGLGNRGAALAGLGFGFSGFQALWLGFSLGHVSPCLPWILCGLEGLRRGAGAAAVVGIAGATALSILGGHPETTFFVACAVVPWTVALLREEPRLAGRALGALACGSLLAAPMLLPFLEYLGLSAARHVREAESARAGVDLLALGGVLAAGGLLGTWRRRTAGRAGGVLALAAPALVLGGAALLLARRGLPETAGLALVPDLLGFPGDGTGYRGPGALAEEASAWVAAPVLALALAGLLGAGGRLRRRALVGTLAVVSMLLCLRAPGVLDVYRLVPTVGLAATVRAGAVGALMLALLAGAALEAAGPLARRAGALAVLLLGGLVLAGGREVPLPPGLATGPESDELVVLTRVPDAEPGAARLPLAGWVDARVPAARARVRARPLDAAGRPHPDAVYLFPVELGPAPAGAPPGARGLHAPTWTSRHFSAGLWRFDLELLDAAGTVLGERRIRVARLSAPRALRPGSAAAWALTLMAVALPPGAGLAAAAAALLLLVAALQGALFTHRANPVVPHGEVFPPTRTEALLAEGLGLSRYLGEPGVLPPSTGMVRGLRAADGYDGMDPTSFNVYRELVVHPGTHALLGWSARGVDLDSPGLRLLGVDWLATRSPLEHPRYERVAAPPGRTRAGEPEAEVFLYRARDPLPRAFVVGELRTADEIGADLAAWDPLEAAVWEGAGTLERPCTTASVEDLELSNDEVRLTATLDGDGLLVVTEQVFPGWTATVDGAPAEVGPANAIFRGVLLGPGRHEVVLRYVPTGWRLGLLLAALGAAGTVLVALAARRRRPG